LRVCFMVYISKVWSLFNFYGFRESPGAVKDLFPWQVHSDPSDPFITHHMFINYGN